MTQKDLVATTPHRRVRRTAKASEEFARSVFVSLLHINAAQRKGRPEPEIAEKLRQAHLAPRHIVTLVMILLEGDPTVSQVAEAQGIALSTASLLVTQLVDAGLVVRAQDPADRRRWVLSVHPDFRAEGESLVETSLEPLRRAFARLTLEAAATLAESLVVVAEEADRSHAALQLLPTPPSSEEHP